MEQVYKRINPIYGGDNIKGLEVITTATTPSWKKSLYDCKGCNRITFNTIGLNSKKSASGWLEIFASETAYAETANGREVTKEVIITLRLDAAKQLKAMLNELNI